MGIKEQNVEMQELHLPFPLLYTCPRGKQQNTVLKATLHSICEPEMPFFREIKNCSFSR
jgi:hypothetical protein